MTSITKMIDTLHIITKNIDLDFVWILAVDLLPLDLPKKRFHLAYHPPFLRQMNHLRLNNFGMMKILITTNTLITISQLFG